MKFHDPNNNIFFQKQKSMSEDFFDNLGKSYYKINNYLTEEDLNSLYKIATSIKYNANIKMKYKLIDDILIPRGFKKFAAGTNRVVYSYLEDRDILLKIAIDKVGLKDNPDEYKNQHLLKPFVTKCYDISYNGIAGLFERIIPITTPLEFVDVAEDIFSLLVNKILGKYVIDDIGIKHYTNWGIRSGFGPTLLDYPYVFELDGNKLYCNTTDMYGKHCMGEIDYDNGFNKLICTECGRSVQALELEKINDNNKNNIIMNKGETNMNISIIKITEDGEVEVYNDNNTSTGVDYIGDEVIRNNKSTSFVEDFNLDIVVVEPEEMTCCVEEEDLNSTDNYYVECDEQNNATDMNEIEDEKITQDDITEIRKEDIIDKDTINDSFPEELYDEDLNIEVEVVVEVVEENVLSEDIVKEEDNDVVVELVEENITKLNFTDNIKQSDAIRISKFIDDDSTTTDDNKPYVNTSNYELKSVDIDEDELYGNNRRKTNKKKNNINKY